MRDARTFKKRPGVGTLVIVHGYTDKPFRAVVKDYDQCDQDDMCVTRLGRRPPGVNRKTAEIKLTRRKPVRISLTATTATQCQHINPMNTDELPGPESRLGYAGTFIFAGEIVAVKAKGFGRGCNARVLKLGAPGLASVCEIEITRPGANCRAGWAAGNRLNLCAGWLEGEKI